MEIANTKPSTFNNKELRLNTENPVNELILDVVTSLSKVLLGDENNIIVKKGQTESELIITGTKSEIQQLSEFFQNQGSPWDFSNELAMQISKKMQF